MTAPITGGIRPHQSVDGAHSAVDSAQDAAVAADRDRIATGLNDVVIQHLFGVGLDLQGVLGAVEEPVRSRLLAAIESVDVIIHQIRDTIFVPAGRSPRVDSLPQRIVQTVTRTGFAFDPELDFDGRFDQVSRTSGDNLISILGDVLGLVALEETATWVRISCAVSVEVVLTVSDNRRQHEADLVARQGDPMLSERVGCFGGWMANTAGPDGGMRSTYRVPVTAGW